jgi:N utilization substance protein B
VSADSGLVEALKTHYDHFAVSHDLRPFVGELVAGTLTSLSMIDETLEKHTANWRIARLSSIDRCILRMATYELIDLPQIPRAVVIDEAIELAKEFGSDESASFVNGVLDQVAVPEPERLNA